MASSKASGEVERTGRKKCGGLVVEYCDYGPGIEGHQPYPLPHYHGRWMPH